MRAHARRIERALWRDRLSPNGGRSRSLVQNAHAVHTPELPEGVRSVSKRVCNENGPNLEKSAMCAQRKQIMNYVIKLKNTVAHQNKRNRSEEIRYALSVSTAHYRSQCAVCSGW